MARKKKARFLIRVEVLHSYEIVLDADNYFEAAGRAKANVWRRLIKMKPARLCKVVGYERHNL